MSKQKKQSRDLKIGSTDNAAWKAERKQWIQMDRTSANMGLYEAYMYKIQ